LASFYYLAASFGLHYSLSSDHYTRTRTWMHTETIYREVGDLRLYIKDIFKMYVQCIKVKSISVAQGQPTNLYNAL
jgi:hypothetical protein